MLKWFSVGFVVAWIIFNPSSFGEALEMMGWVVGEFGEGFAEGSRDNQS